MPDQVKKVLRKMQTEGIFSTLEKVQAKLDQPIPLGYSCAGVVAEAGAGVSGLCAGDRVACGGAGYANHAQYNYVPKNLVVRIPDAVSMEDASCATVGSIALQGVRQCDLGRGDQPHERKGGGDGSGGHGSAPGHVLQKRAGFQAEPVLWAGPV
jgi:NADPH:quinone reductase-like Zn-dependent oxidoreductase